MEIITRRAMFRESERDRERDVGNYHAKSKKRGGKKVVVPHVLRLKYLRE